jgi:hypothetical protein
VIEVGERIPGVHVWREPPGSDPVPLDALLDERGLLLLFYLYDWSTT